MMASAVLVRWGEVLWVFEALVLAQIASCSRLQILRGLLRHLARGRMGSACVVASDTYRLQFIVNRLNATPRRPAHLHHRP